VKGFNLSAFAVREQALTLFLVIVIVIAGSVAFLRLGRAETPEITVKAMVVSARWPGASAAEMQSQVADPLERRVQELRYLDRVETVARPGQLTMSIVLKDTMPISALQNEFYQVRKKLGDAAAGLPRGVAGPFFNDDYADVYFALYTLAAPELPHRELVRTAEEVRQRLLRVRGVKRVDLIGEQAQRIYVEFSYRRLAALGIGPDALAEALSSRNDLVPAGFVDTAGPRIQLRTEGALDTLEAVRASPIEVGGKTLKIADVAEVRRGYEEPARFRILADGEPAVMLGVNMQPKFNGMALDELLETQEEAIHADLPLGIHFSKVADQARNIAASVNEFAIKFVVALAVVIGATFLAMGFRVGLVVAAAVPLTLGITFVVMLLRGHNIDLVSLGALIVSLGLLVDDAIIAIEMMVVKMGQGLDRIAAAAYAWHATAAPMLSGTLVTVIGFIPIGLAPSGVSEFSGDLFWVVAYALIASWFVAVIIIPYLGVKLLPPIIARGAHDPDAAYSTPGYARLRRWIERCVTARKRVVLGVIAAFLVCAAAVSLLEQQFFPQSDRPEVLIDIILPQESAIAETERVTRGLEAQLRRMPGVDHVSGYVGAGSPRFFVSLNPELPDPSFAKIVVIAKDSEAREQVLQDIHALIAKNPFPEARIRVDRLTMGPPVPYPVAFRVVGTDMAVLRRIAVQVRAVMQAEPLVRDPRVEAAARVPTLRLRFDQERLRQLGLTVEAVSGQLQTILQGRTVTQVRDDLRAIDLVVRATDGERKAIGEIGDASIVTASGVPVPLSQVAALEPVSEEPLLTRRNRESYIGVQSDVVDGAQAPDVTHRVSAALKPLEARLPPGYRIDIGGAIEESDKANAAIAAMLPLMVMLMLAVIMVQVRSFSAMFLVIATAPLGLIGAVPALLVTDHPFGFTAILGLIGLAGIIMRNTLILVDQIRQNKAAGLGDRAAVVEATVHRARPVLLTALAAMLAFAPLTLSTFWGGLAIVLIGGVLVGTALTLFFLPALYAMWFRIGRAGRRS
jgi:multidrug efflux pump subunit AcrB